MPSGSSSAGGGYGGQTGGTEVPVEKRVSGGVSLPGCHAPLSQCPLSPEEGNQDETEYRGKPGCQVGGVSHCFLLSRT